MFAAQVQKFKVRFDGAEQSIDASVTGCRNVETGFSSRLGCRVANGKGFKCPIPPQRIAGTADAVRARQQETIKARWIGAGPGDRFNFEQGHANGIKAELTRLGGRRAGAWLRTQDEQPGHSGCEQPPDRGRRSFEQANSKRGSLLLLAAVKNGPVFHHVATVFAEQLSPQPEIAVLERAKCGDR